MPNTRPIRFLIIVSFTIFASALAPAQDWENIQLHGYATQGFLYSSKNNYLTMNSSSGSLQWTDGAISVMDKVTDNLRVGIQLHMYQLGQFGGDQVQIDWAQGDYKVSDYFGIRAGKVKTVLGLFNDSQDVEPVFLWSLLPQSVYPIDNRGFMLAQLGGAVYGDFGLGARRGRLRYVVEAGQLTLDQNQGYAEQLAEVGLVFNRYPRSTTYGGDLRWVAPLKGLTVGASGIVDDIKGGAANGSVQVPSFLTQAYYAQFEKHNWFFAGEYWRIPYSMTVNLGPLTFPWRVDQRSWYVMASHRLQRKVEVGTYYSHYCNKAGNTSDPEYYSKDWVISGRYDFNNYFYGKLEGHFVHGDALGYYQIVNPSGLASNSKMLAAKIGFTF
jgi:hypothetical protein